MRNRVKMKEKYKKPFFICEEYSPKEHLFIFLLLFNLTKRIVSTTKKHIFVTDYPNNPNTLSI